MVHDATPLGIQLLSLRTQRGNDLSANARMDAKTDKTMITTQTRSKTSSEAVSERRRGRRKPSMTRWCTAALCGCLQNDVQACGAQSDKERSPANASSDSLRAGVDSSSGVGCWMKM